VATVLSGARSAAEIEENVRLFALDLPSALWRALRDEGLIDSRAPVPTG
jgi:D-threo-aldose 1-dehydrogenase